MYYTPHPTFEETDQRWNSYPGSGSLETAEQALNSGVSASQLRSWCRADCLSRAGGQALYGWGGLKSEGKSGPQQKQSLPAGRHAASRLSPASSGDRISTRVGRALMPGSLEALPQYLPILPTRSVLTCPSAVTSWLISPPPSLLCLQPALHSAFGAAFLKNTSDLGAPEL